MAFALLILVILVPGLTACQTVRENTLTQVRDREFTSTIVSTPFFDLQSYHRIRPEAQVLRVYIEGDGRAWLNRTTPSDDPTPDAPTALQLAMRDQGEAVLYIARPCQYVGGEAARNCAQRYWTTDRYSRVVVDAIEEAIQFFVDSHNLREVEVVGFSGGGTLAMLLSPRRIPIRIILTVSGVLDINAWTTHHSLTPLFGSLNPATEDMIGIVPSTHLAGGEDSVVPPHLTHSALENLSVDYRANVRTIVFPEYDHHCCWVDNWEKILATYLP